MYFRLFVIIPLKKDVALHLKDALCQAWLKLAQRFWRRRILNFVNVFSLFRYYLPLEKGRVLHLNKLESPLPKDALCQVWLKLDQWFWRRRFLNFVNVFSPFRNHSLEKGRGPSFKGCFVPSLVEIGPAVLEKKNFKFRQCIFTISLLSPLGKVLGPSFEQTLCQVWLKLAQ